MKIEKQFTPVTLTVVLETPEEYDVFMNSISSFKLSVAKKQVLTDLQDEEKDADKEDKATEVEVAERVNLEDAVKDVLKRQGSKTTAEIHKELPGNSYPAVASAVFRLKRRGTIGYDVIKNSFGKNMRHYYVMI